MIQKSQRPMLARLCIWVLHVAIFAPAIVLAGAALPRLVSGFALAPALPVPYLIGAKEELPTTAYKAARDALAHASNADGQAKIWQAEAAYLAGSQVQDVQSTLSSALDRAPSSAQGWTLLAEIQATRDPKGAASALGLALQLAPFDYWLASRRANVGARLWNGLNVEERDLLLRQTRLLWSEEQLRDKIGPLFATQEGAALAGHAFADDPDILRELNRRATRDDLRNFVAP
jgi:hypothetical protein